MEDWILIALRALRQEKNYSQEYIASKLNISQSYYGRIENGKSVLTIVMLHRILDFFEIDYTDFFHLVKEMEKKSSKKMFTSST